VKSNGHARVILFTDSIYAIAATKTEASRATIEGCGGCKVLTVADTPIADLGNRMGQLITSPTHSISYADAVKTTTGDSAAESAFRLFLIPGLYHCDGGIGPAHTDVLSAVVAWVEECEALQALLARAAEASGPSISIPLWPPLTARGPRQRGVLHVAGAQQTVQPTRLGRRKSVLQDVVNRHRLCFAASERERCASNRHRRTSKSPWCIQFSAPPDRLGSRSRTGLSRPAGVRTSVGVQRGRA
jgi:hypothetical protein